MTPRGVAGLWLPHYGNVSRPHDTTDHCTTRLEIPNTTTMSDAAPTGAEPPSKNALKKAQKEKEKVSRIPSLSSS